MLLPLCELFGAVLISAFFTGLLVLVVLGAIKVGEMWAERSEKKKTKTHETDY